MGAGLAEKIKHESRVWDYVEKIKNLFRKVDRRALEKAIEEQNLESLCEVLKVSPEDIKSLLQQGHEKTQELMKKHPEFAEAVEKAQKKKI